MISTLVGADLVYPCGTLSHVLRTRPQSSSIRVNGRQEFLPWRRAAPNKGIRKVVESNVVSHGTHGFVASVPFPDPSVRVRSPFPSALEGSRCREVTWVKSEACGAVSQREGGGGGANDDRGLFLGPGSTNSIQDKSALARPCQWSGRRTKNRHRCHRIL